MQERMMKKNIADILAQKDGVVLVMVLLVLVATVIIGISVSRSSFIELKIAGNSLTCKRQFYQAESAVNIALDNYVEAFSTLGVNVGNTYTFAQAGTLKDDLDGASVEVKLTAITKPAYDTGYDVSKFRMRRYAVDAKKGYQDVEVGVYKVFPISE